MPTDDMTTPTGTESPDASNEIAELFDESAASELPEIPAADPETQAQSADPTPPVTPPAPLPASVLEEFDIDGRTVGKEALFQTYRQFSHLQGVHQQSKPFLDLMREYELTPEQIPQFKAWVAKQIAGSAADVPAEVPLEQESWFQEVADIFPHFASMLKQEREARQSSASELAQLRETLNGFTGAMVERQRQEAGLTVLSKAAEIIETLYKDYDPLQPGLDANSPDALAQGERRRQFLTWLWNEKRPTGAQLNDPDYMEGMYLRYNRDGLAERMSAQALKGQQAHAATVTRAFAETGAPRAAAAGATLSPHERELSELFSD